MLDGDGMAGILLRMELSAGKGVVHLALPRGPAAVPAHGHPHHTPPRIMIGQEMGGSLYPVRDPRLCDNPRRFARFIP